jgi:hypothetical protein
MGQTPSTHHSKRQDSLGYFLFAFMQPELAFFIGSKILVLSCSILIFFDKIIFECPINVPFVKFCDKKSSIYLSKPNQRQGICHPLLLIFIKLTILLSNFYGGYQMAKHRGIEERTAPDGTVSYRAKIRIKGHPSVRYNRS